jgi:hypothetical protein
LELSKTDILIITPPLTQLNAPYPAASYLIAYVKEKGYLANQYDLSIDLVDKVFSYKFLKVLADKFNNENLETNSGKFFIKNKDKYVWLIEPVKYFLRMYTAPP